MKLGSEPQDSIFVLANDVVIFLYKQRKNIVVTPFKILDIKELVIAENVPSACTMQVDETVEDKIGRSHLIFESKSMGLILRYVLERNYEEIEVDFSDSVPIRDQGVEKDFCFTDLDAIRQEKADEENNGTLRATYNSQMYILDEGGMFKSDTWLPIYGIMTNIGLFRCNREQPLQLLPKIMRLHRLKLEELKGSYSGRRYCFRLQYINDKEKESEKIFSVDDQETYNMWIKKVKKTVEEYRRLGNSMLLSPAALKNSEG